MDAFWQNILALCREARDASRKGKWQVCHARLCSASETIQWCKKTREHPEILKRIEALKFLAEGKARK